MTDVDEPTPGLRVPSELAEVQNLAQPPSVGQQLQRARLDAGLSLEHVSARLKVSVARLQALESDQFEQGANLHVGRAMVASVARMLGLDAQALLAQLPHPPIHRPVPEAHEAMGGLGKAKRLSVRGNARAPVVPVVPTVPASSALSASSSPALPASAPAAVPTPAPGRGVSSAHPVQPVLWFKARGNTWVEVTDGKGTVLLRRTLATSETIDVAGDLPLSVVIGRADHTEVMLRGAAFPLETHTQDNVARFKVP